MAFDDFTYHPMQQKLWAERFLKRFQLVAAGRRSGKTEIGKRKLVDAMCNPPHADAHYFAGAPTHAQAKRIWWDDMCKHLEPITVGKPNKSELTITTFTGATLLVTGLDAPERIEGTPWDGCAITEIASVKPAAWTQNIAPSLDTPGRVGWATLEGVPEGRNWFYDLVKRVESGVFGDSWGYYHWKSSEVLPPEIIKQARLNLDELTFNQEYCAEFVNFEGQAYYGWSEGNVKERTYDPNRPLHLCFDFNVSPGISVAIQQFGDGDYVVEEIHIPRNSNTEMVCNRWVALYHNHQEDVYLYGDATGESRKTSGLVGTDWHIIKNILSEGMPYTVIYPRIPAANPRERARVNAVNSRIKDGTGERRLFASPRCVHTIKDFEGVAISEKDGSIDKSDQTISHISDAIGYYVNRLYPISSFDPTKANMGRVVVGSGANF